ncbi:hypothetical protein FSARC_10453, partial [Fusarium sarcochroum]
MSSEVFSITIEDDEHRPSGRPNQPAPPPTSPP